MAPVERMHGMTVDDREQFRDRSRQLADEMAGDHDLTALDHRIIAASDQRSYSYMWTWLGLPVIQMPSDIVLMQEIIWENRPQVIVETGFARGGSTILYSTVLELIGEGTVVAVDIEFREHNRAAVESHPLGHRVRYVEGSSTDDDVLAQVSSLIDGAERVMVVLDSDHTHDHVLEEMRRYAPLVTPGQFLVVADTVVEHIPVQEHRPRRWGPGDNPQTAVDQFLAENPDTFDVDAWSNNKLLMSSSRGGYLRKLP
jgi:cephalosporin hydroxylase